MRTKTAIDFLETVVASFRKEDPDMGLPQELFHFVSRSTPIVNVDLLIKDEQGRVRLSWRDDQFAGSGWHIPGGIVRFKETMEERLVKVADIEIGRELEHDPSPVCFKEVFLPHDTSGHFVSFLYNCFLSSDFEPSNLDSQKQETDPGFLKWHDRCPDNLVSVQEMYRPYIEGTYFV